MVTQGTWEQPHHSVDHAKCCELPTRQHYIPNRHFFHLGGREILVPFRRPIVTRVDREAREIELDPPDGLLEL